MATIKQFLGIILYFLLFTYPLDSSASIVILNGLTHEMIVKPGETYRGTIEIQNTKEAAQSVKIYLRDYSFNYSGEAFYDEPGTLPRSNTGWILFSPSYMILSSKETVSVSFEVTVPAGETLVGTYWSAIMVEGEAPVEDSKLAGGFTIQTQIRYAVQISTTVEAAGERNLTFLEVHPFKEGNNWVLAVDIENRGDYLIKPDVSVELYNAHGTLVGSFIATRRKLYPKTSTRFILELQDITTGAYQTLVLADGGGEDVFGINLELDLRDD